MAKVKSARKNAEIDCRSRFFTNAEQMGIIGEVVLTSGDHHLVYIQPRIAQMGKLRICANEVKHCPVSTANIGDAKGMGGWLCPCHMACYA